MQKRSWPKLAFAALASASVLYGAKLNRAAIKALGGNYSLLTELKSDAAANLMHRFNNFRGFSLIAAFICIMLLWLLMRISRKTVFCTLGIYTLYALSCLVYYVCFLSAPNAIVWFALKRAVCSALFIAAPILLSDKPLP